MKVILGTMPGSPWRTLLLLLFLAVPDIAVLAQELPPASDQPIRVDVNLVTLRFSVRSEAGQFLNRLSSDDFAVYENNRRVLPSFFEQPKNDGQDSRPLWLAFLLDVSGSTFATRAEEILAAQSFFENVHDFTKVGIYGFTDQLIPFQEFTADRKAAGAAFGSARAHLGRTAIYSSLSELMSIMNGHANSRDRKVIIVVSDGIDDAYREAPRAVALARKHDVTIYTIWVPSAAQLYIGPSSGGQAVASKDAEKEAKEAAFARLAASTGGRHFGGFEAILDFDEVLAEINDELFGNLYALGYYTEHPEFDRFEREIRVEVNRPNAFIQGLFENLPERVQTKKRYIEALFDAAGTALLPPGGENFREIGADIDLLRQRQEGQDLVQPFRIKISPFSLYRGQGGEIRTQLGVIGLLTDLDGNEVGRLREIFRSSLEKKDIRDGRGIIYTNRLVAPPGNYLLKVAILEIPTWRMTVLERSVEMR